MSEQIAVERVAAPDGWRPRLALMLFILAIVSPLVAPLVVASDMPSDSMRAVAALLLFGIPMALILAVVALIGRPAYSFIKIVMPGQDTAPAAVGVARYRTGGVLVLLGMLVSWVEPLVSSSYADIAARRVLIGACADAMVLVGLFVLGADFWDKFHALFVHDARVRPDPMKAAVLPTLIKVTWRFYAGVIVLVCCFGAWGLVPLASAAGWSTSQIAKLSGAIFIGSKVGLITAIAIMGKDGFNYFKQVVGGFLSNFAPAHQVSRSRYQLGLLLVLVPMLMTWAAPYVTDLLRTGSVFGFLQELSLEVLLLVGLFLLGGEFWDKLRALFSHRARVDLPRAARG